mgnify:FL=1|jgi:Flp pilus assembly protein TadD
MIRLSSACACLAFALAAVLSAPVSADDLQEARRLMAQGSLGSALDRVEAVLAKQPRDARARFMKGVILTEQGKTPEAIKLFTALTEEFPELPEPYNNLAVLYAAQGQDDKARKALEMAIRTHPTYATAHENLGDIYAKMAREAYDKALQLDSGNSSARAKLALVRELFSQKPGAQQAPVRATVPEPPAALPPPPAVVAATQTPMPVTVAPAAPPKPASPSVENAPILKPGATGDSPSDAAGAEDEVVRTLQAWARAWSAGDARQYLAYYAPGFRPPGGQSRAAWEQSRRERVVKGKRIVVQVQAPKVTFAKPEEAVVTFRQVYQSDSLSTSGRKRITMVRQNGRWLIQREEVVR